MCVLACLTVSPALRSVRAWKNESADLDQAKLFQGEFGFFRICQAMAQVTSSSFSIHPRPSQTCTREPLFVCILNGIWERFVSPTSAFLGSKVALPEFKARFSDHHLSTDEKVKANLQGMLGGPYGGHSFILHYPSSIHPLPHVG